MQLLRGLVSGRSISLVSEIAKSGEGTVWDVDQTGCVAKIYHDPTPERIKKLQIMIASPPSDPMLARNHITFAWPQDILVDSSGKPLGFLMPKVGDSVPLSTIYNPRLRSRKAPRFNWHYLHTTALNFAMAVQALHREGYVIGDIKPQNILVNKSALISVIDTDSFQVRDPYSRQVFRCLVGSEGFTPAELLGKELSKIDQTDIHDRFRLGVIIYLLLFGDHPFKGKWMSRGESPLPSELVKLGYWPYAQRSLIKPGPNTIPLNVVHSGLQTRFHECFTQGHGNPDVRPTAQQWVNALNIAIRELTVCGLEPNHVFDRTYGKCYWCDRNARLGVDIFNPDLKKKIDQAQKLKAQQQKQKQLQRQHAAQRLRSPVMRSVAVASGVKSQPKFSMTQLRQDLAAVPPTWVGAILCMSSLMGLGLLLLPEFLQYDTFNKFSMQLEQSLRSVLKIGADPAQYSSRTVSDKLGRGLGQQGLSHADTITHLTISPDGRYVASGSRDMNVKIWNLDSGEFVRSLTQNFEPINYVKFSQDGAILLSSSQAGNVVLWSFPDGKVLKTLDKASETGGGSLLNATTDPQGQFLVSNGWSGGILIHNLLTNQLNRIETSTLASEQALLALPNSNNALFSTSSSGQVNVWDLKTGKARYSFPTLGQWQPIEPVRVMTSDRKGKLLVTGNWSGTINLWDHKNGVITQSFNGHSPSYVSAMAMSSNGKWLATGGGDNLIKLWNLKTGRMAKMLAGHQDDITALEFSPNSKVLVSGSKDKTVKVWQIPANEKPVTLVQE